MKKSLIIASVFIIGIALGVLTFSYNGYGRGFKHLESFSKLPSDKQALLIETMSKVHEENYSLREDMKAARKSMIDTLTAEKFDPNAFQQSVDKMHDLHGKKIQTMADGVKSLAPRFTQEEREILAQILPKGRHGRGGHHKARSDYQ
jgi:uncharacterized membrane protein